MLKRKNASDYIVFPLDVPSETEAIQLVQELTGYVGMFKIGLELFFRSGPGIVRKIREYGSTEIFLDLKLHDIPVTVQRAVSSVSKLGVRFITAHCGENPEMLKAAVSGGGNSTGILGVTVLTSISGKHLQEAGFRKQFFENPGALVLKRAKTALDAGCAGVVCSGREVAEIKGVFGNSLVAVTPGIRPSRNHVKQDDQERITTPEKAILDGSDYLVIGRPIRDAHEPREAARIIADEIASALLMLRPQAGGNQQ